MFAESIDYAQLTAYAFSRFRVMWTATTSGTSNASQHHIQVGMHVSKVTLKSVDPFEEIGFVFNGAGLLERNGLIGSVAFPNDCITQFQEGSR